MKFKEPPVISIIIVSYNVREFLEQALRSVTSALVGCSHEIIVVDNASSDGTPAFVRKHFPDVRLIANGENLGFARANNLGIKLCSGEYICLLNPDTIVQEDTFSTLLSFFEKNPQAGMVGAKILNPDGTLQLACRRSFPTPWVAFTKIVGLARLFPGSRLFGRYNLTFLDPDKTAEVEAISGSFMMVRRQVVEEIGGLDEDFFMYGEDLDWCYRVNRAGWKIYYVPDTQIIHFKGESSKKSPFQQRRLFYEAMRLFVHKHFKKGSALIPSWLLVAAIYASAGVSFIVTLLKKLVWPFIDLLVLTAAMSSAVFFRFRPVFPWEPFVIVHVVYSLVWLVSLAAHGLYSKNHLSGSKAASAAMIGLLVNSTFTFFFKQWAFSRAVVLIAGAFNLIALPLWRFLLKWHVRKGNGTLSRRLGSTLVRRDSLIVGDEQSAGKLVQRLEENAIYSIKGIVSTERDFPEKIAGVLVVGAIDDLPEIVRRERAREVIFATETLPYDVILNAVAGAKSSNISFRLAPSNLDVVIGKATIDYIDDIPFVDLEYRLHNDFFKKIKRVFDVSLTLLSMVLLWPLYVWHRWVRKESLKKESIRIDRNRYSQVHVFQSIENSFVKYLPLLPAILRGDMSFVGRENWFDEGESDNSASLMLKPGLAGFEQANPKKDLSADERRRYHLFYLKNYSPFLDIELLLKTMFKRK